MSEWFEFGDCVVRKEGIQQPSEITQKRHHIFLENDRQIKELWVFYVVDAGGTEFRVESNTAHEAVLRRNKILNYRNGWIKEVK